MESFRVHDEIWAEMEKQSYTGTSHPPPQHQTPRLEGRKHPLRNTPCQAQYGAGKHLAAGAAAHYLFLHSQFAFLDRKGVMREQGVKILWETRVRQDGPDGTVAKAACTERDGRTGIRWERAFVLRKRQTSRKG